MNKPRAKNSLNVIGWVVVHIALTLPLAYLLNIWADEASTLHTTQHGFFVVFQNAAADEKQAPLYFWVLSLWRSINDSIFFARLFSVISSAVAIKVFAGLAQRFFEHRAALLATAFFAMHPFLIWASLEIRVYSLVILISVWLIKLFFDAFPDADQTAFKTPNRFAKVWFFYAATIALYTNYYLGFLLVGFFLVLLVTRRWSQIRSYVGIMLIAAIAFAPLIIAVWSQFVVNTSGFQEERSLLDGLRHLWNRMITFILPAEIIPGEQASTFSVVRSWIVRLAVLIFSVIAIRDRKVLSGRTLQFAVMTAVICIFLFLAYLAIGPTYIAIRHASILFAPLILFVASIVSDVFKEKSETTVRITTLAVGLTVLISFSYSLITLYPNTTKRGDWERVGAFIEQNESPGQPIIIFYTFDAIALPYYYRGINHILPDERFFDFDLEAEFGTANSLKRQTDFVISEIPPDAEHIWLAVNEKCLITEACVPLENFVRANYTIEIEKEFYLEKLFLLKKKQQ